MVYKRRIKGKEYWYKTVRIEGKTNPVPLYILPVIKVYSRKRNAPYNSPR